MLHLTWSIEKNGCCPCGGEVVLATPSCWDVDEDSCAERLGDDVFEKFAGGASIEEEVSGHICVECGRLTSLSLNGKAGE